MKRINKNIICNGNYYFVEGITVAEAIAIVKQMFLKSIKAADPKCTYSAAEAEAIKRINGCNFTYIRPACVDNTYDIGRPMTDQDKYIMEWNNSESAKAINVIFDGKSYKVTSDAFEAMLRI